MSKKDKSQIVHEAVHRGNLNDVKRVMKSSKNLVGIQNATLQTPLHVASSEGHLAVVLWLIEKKKADVNARDRDNWTPLHCACHAGHLEVVDQLLSHDAQVCIETSNGSSPLDYFVRIPDQSTRPALFERLFRTMFRKGAQVNKQNGSGETPLHMASFRGKEKSVSLLLAHQADPNLKNKYGETALHLATRNNYLRIVQQLLEANVDYTIAGKSSGTAYDIARENKDPQILKLFEERCKMPASTTSIAPTEPKPKTHHPSSSTVGSATNTQTQPVINTQPGQNQPARTHANTMNNLGGQSGYPQMVDSQFYGMHSGNFPPNSATATFNAGPSLQNPSGSYRAPAGSTLYPPSAYNPNPSYVSNPNMNPVYGTSNPNSSLYITPTNPTGTGTGVYGVHNPNPSGQPYYEGPLNPPPSGTGSIRNVTGVYNPSGYPQYHPQNSMQRPLPPGANPQNTFQLQQQQQQNTLQRPQGTQRFPPGQYSPQQQHHNPQYTQQYHQTNNPMMNTGQFQHQHQHQQNTFNRPQPPPPQHSQPPPPQEQPKKPAGNKKKERAPPKNLEHYVLGECIGTGAFGSVYNGFDSNTGVIVAIKQVSLKGVPPGELANIMAELNLLKRLEHPHIVKYIGFIRDEQNLNIILEFIEGGSLSSILKKFGGTQEPLCARYVSQTLLGLDYLHRRGVIHRDIKSGNILVTKDGLVKLADFGIAAVPEGQEDEEAALATIRDVNQYKDQSSNKDAVGSPYWMAPEVIKMEGASSNSDIWSLGCTIIELLTGNPPYIELAPMPALFAMVNDPHPPLPDKLSPELRDFLLLCFKKVPSERPTARDLLQHKWIVTHLGDLSGQLSSTLSESATQLPSQTPVTPPVPQFTSTPVLNTHTPHPVTTPAPAPAPSNRLPDLSGLPSFANLPAHLTTAPTPGMDFPTLTGVMEHLMALQDSFVQDPTPPAPEPQVAPPTNKFAALNLAQPSREILDQPEREHQETPQEAEPTTEEEARELAFNRAKRNIQEYMGWMDLALKGNRHDRAIKVRSALRRGVKGLARDWRDEQEARDLAKQARGLIRSCEEQFADFIGIDSTDSDDYSQNSFYDDSDDEEFEEDDFGGF